MGKLYDIRARRGTAATWASTNPTLAAGEPGLETDTRRLKFGDGSTAWASLPYFGESGDPIPPSGSWWVPPYVLSAAVAAVTSGFVVFHKLKVGPQGFPISALGCYVGTASSGGTLTTSLGVYPDNGSGGLPDCSVGPLYSGTVTTTSTGLRTVAVSGTLPQGTYWVALLYYAAVAPTTPPTLAAPNNATSLWISNANLASGVFTSRCITLPTQIALPTSQPAASSFAPILNSLASICFVKAA